MLIHFYSKISFSWPKCKLNNNNRFIVDVRLSLSHPIAWIQKSLNWVIFFMSAWCLNRCYIDFFRWLLFPDAWKWKSVLFFDFRALFFNFLCLPSVIFHFYYCMLFYCCLTLWCPFCVWTIHFSRPFFNKQAKVPSFHRFIVSWTRKNHFCV